MCPILSLPPVMVSGRGPRGRRRKEDVAERSTYLIAQIEQPVKTLVDTPDGERARRKEGTFVCRSPAAS